MTTQQLKKGARGWLAFLALLLTCTVAKAQTDFPYYSVYIANDNLVNSTTYEFDVFIVADASTPTWNLRQVQLGLFLDPAFRNGGTLTRSYVAGSSTLSPTFTFTLNNTGSSTAPDFINMTTAAIPNPGTVITTTPAKICRLRLVNTVAFGCVSPNIRFNYRQTSGASNLRLRTDISNWNTGGASASFTVAQASTSPYACTGTPQGNFPSFNGDGLWSCSDADGASNPAANANLTVSLSGLAASYASTDPQVTLTGSPAGGTFSGPGVSGNFFNPSAAGTGPVVVTYSYTWPGTSCTRVASFTTNVTGACTVEAFATGTNATCQGANNGTASASATGSSPFTYSWAPGGETTENISGLAPGTYTVTVTATGGCTATASYTVLDGPAPTYNSTSVSACVSYIWSVNSQTYTASGSYTAQVGPCAYEVLDLTVTPQPPAPTGLACYETASFNNTTCSWDVTGTQPAMPTWLATRRLRSTTRPVLGT